MGLISEQRFEFHKQDRISSMDPDQFHNHDKERLNVLLVEHFGEVDSSLAVVVAAVDSSLVVAAVERVVEVVQPAAVAQVVAQVERGAFEQERQVEGEIAFFQLLEKK